MEYDDLPELQELDESPSSPVLFHVGGGVSRQECIAGSPHTNWLTELAIIATSPQSPLLQEDAPNERSSPVHIFSTNRSLHSYARPPLASSAPSPSRGHLRERSRRVRASSESESGVFSMASFSDDEDMGWSHSWPSTAWHCFLKGTRLRFHRGPNKEWQEAEDLGDSDDESDDERMTPFTSLKSYGSEGLKLVAHEDNVSYGQAVLKLTFDPGSPEEGLLTAECRFDHPFFVKNKGKQKQIKSNFICHIHMVKVCPCIPYRAISVILGEKWKKMKNEERRMYTMEAKALADEQKRLNPDCWKRKRTNSGSQQP
uniref:HMG box-containing protein 1 n=1 Tax=Hucho hucho TaxID=62062 RepID=A0A4W5R781_9TELE